MPATQKLKSVKLDEWICLTCVPTFNHVPTLRLLPHYFVFNKGSSVENICCSERHISSAFFTIFLSRSFSSDLLWGSVFCPQTPKECTAATNFHCACLHHALFPWSLTAAVHSKHGDVGYPTIPPPPLCYFHGNYTYQFFFWGGELRNNCRELAAPWEIVAALPLLWSRLYRGCES